MSNIKQLELKSVPFYSYIDEDNFFNWIRQIPCIEKYKGISRSLFLFINTDKLDKYDLIALSALFVRYNIDTAPLKLLKQQYGPKWKTNLLDSHTSS